MSHVDFNMFPKYYRNSVKCVSDVGFICVTTFWTKKEDIYNLIDKNLLNKIILIGNLYTQEGIKYIILNSCLCPQIEYFIFIGEDRNNVKQHLRYENAFNLRYDNVDLEERFFKHFDSTRMYFASLNNINTVICSLKSKRTNWIYKPIVVKEKEPEMLQNESEKTGFIVRDSNLERLWKRILTKIKLFGQVKNSDNGSLQKELLAVVSVLTDKAKLFNDMPNVDIIDSYIPQVCDELNLSSTLSYTYGSRLHEYNQINNCIEELRKFRHSRRAISVTWRANIDTISKYPPCLILVDFKVQNNSLFMTCYFRSHDAYNAYCMNVYALQQLQIKVSQSINCDLGYITIISNSCHIYDKDFEKLNDFNELDCNLDSRGYFLVSIEDNNIIVRLMNNNNHKLIKEFKSSSDRELLDSIQPYISEISHALYMGRELSIAHQCILDGTEYHQS